jgi:hypothetical protein
MPRLNGTIMPASRPAGEEKERSPPASDLSANIRSSLAEDPIRMT